MDGCCNGRAPLPSTSARTTSTRRARGTPRPPGPSPTGRAPGLPKGAPGGGGDSAPGPAGAAPPPPPRRGRPALVAAVEQDRAEEGTTKYGVVLEDGVVGWLQWQAEEDPDYRHASMDIYLDPAVHGHGLGTDALRTVARHLFDDHGHHRI